MGTSLTAVRQRTGVSASKTAVNEPISLPEGDVAADEDIGVYQ